MVILILPIYLYPSSYSARNPKVMTHRKNLAHPEMLIFIHRENLAHPEMLVLIHPENLAHPKMLLLAHPEMFVLTHSVLTQF